MIVIVTEKENASDHQEIVIVIESIEARNPRDLHVNHADIDIEEDPDHAPHHPDHHEVVVQDRDLHRIHEADPVLHHEEAAEALDHGNRDREVIHVQDPDHAPYHIHEVIADRPHVHHRYNLALYSLVIYLEIYNAKI